MASPREPLCHDCCVPVGAIHVAGCDAEQCSFCGGQWIACGHEEHDPWKRPWTGELPIFDPFKQAELGMRFPL